MPYVTDMTLTIDRVVSTEGDRQITAVEPQDENGTAEESNLRLLSLQLMGELLLTFPLVAKYSDSWKYFVAKTINSTNTLVKQQAKLIVRN